VRVDEKRRTIYKRKVMGKKAQNSRETGGGDGRGCMTDTILGKNWE